ncbi:MAG: S-methyl-5'-thioadenosine phosphorylase [Nanoarchaeota archaeon]|nr:S-methyl-5'-thioadenosine phosphorylase [Nanoarchaeota archaeon]
MKIGIIGGSGFYDLDIFEEIEEKEIYTPYGKPSSQITVGKIKSVEVVFIARHGKEHVIPPTQINNRANLWALKKEGVTHILATTACGSLREKIGRGDLVILDQFIDFTRLRKISFYEEFEKNKPIHSSSAEPFSNELRKTLIDSAKELGLKYHEKGTVITIEGNRFSTKAESHMFKTWGADVINMSTAPECSLANELGIPYSAVAMSTDYDCWKEDEKPVSIEEIVKVFNENSEKVKKLLTKTIQKIGEK